MTLTDVGGLVESPSAQPILCEEVNFVLVHSMAYHRTGDDDAGCPDMLA